VIYMCSPYSHSDPRVREARYQAACRAAAEFMRAGQLAFSPVAHSHGIAQYGLPGNWKFWEAFDRWFLDRCDELLVVKLPGWRESAGVQAEVAIARKLGKPVSFIEPAEENPGTGRG